MTLSLAFRDAKAMVSFSLLGLQARSLAFNPLDVHGPSHKYIIPCASLPGNSSPIIPFLNFEGSGKIFPVPTSWVLFLCFVFFSSCCCAHRLSPVSADLVRFPKSSHISCRLGFVSFPSSRRFCANEQLPPVCFFFFCHECSTIAAVSQSYCFIHFLLHRFFTSVSKVPSLPIRVSAVTATSLRASVFFFFFSFVRLCKFLWILSRPASFFNVLAFLLSLSVCCLSPRLSGFPLRFSISHTDLQQFLCACPFF